MAKDSNNSNSSSLEIGSVRDYVIWSIFNVSYMNFFCFGLAALFFSIKCRDRKMQGDLEGAQRFARKARALNIAASALSALVFIIFIALAGAGAFRA
ncbi:dispanin subfamily A member 2b-like [Stegostoma tigrinum]|uniref:dispanin subfamily A member 2b-like n=1 Tax=Stegostoma tigrinum TaxID=3053191 RepID=UPI00287059B9|nr:dispanin subfamily A member 2b-like [Stegostoma tigrinum]